MTHVSSLGQVLARYVQVQSTVSGQFYPRQFCATEMQYIAMYELKQDSLWHPYSIHPIITESLGSSMAAPLHAVTGHTHI